VRRKKCFCGGWSFLQGVFAFYGVLVMINRGEVVVDWVVNRGAWTAFFRGLKFSSFLKYIFCGLGVGMRPGTCNGNDAVVAGWKVGVEKRISPLRGPR
jgi:hypothetical protein